MDHHGDHLFLFFVKLSASLFISRPTCSEKHLPGYIEKAEELKAAGAEVVACVSVNDAFVMKAWGEQQKASGKVRMLADAKCELTKALDMELDASAKLGNIRRGTCTCS